MTTTLTPPRATEDSTMLIPKKGGAVPPLFDPEILRRAVKGSFGKLNPVTLMKNPVIFVVEVGAALTTVFLVRDAFIGAHNVAFELQIDLWLWFTVLFATFAEAMAEARGKAQADSLRKTKTDALANRVRENGKHRAGPIFAVALRRCGDLQRGRTDPGGWRRHRRHRHGR